MLLVKSTYEWVTNKRVTPIEAGIQGKNTKD